MGKSILDFTSINGRSGTEFTQVKGRSGTVFWCKPYILTLSSKPTGVDTITCYRYSSQQPGASTGTSAVLTNDSTIYHGDVIYIAATASSGYKAPSISSSTGTISSNMLPVDGNESITVTAGELDVAPVYITAGTGVSSVFLSTNINATSGSASGSNFNIGDAVYGFAVLQTGYNPGSGWEPVSGSIYRVGSIPVAVSGNDFGTINSGDLKSFTISFSGTYCSWGSSSKTAYYGDVLSVSGTTVTCSGTANWTNTCTKYSDTAQYSYGTPSISNGTGTVTAAITVTGTSSRSTRSYTIRFLNWDGSVLQSSAVYYGNTPSYTGSTPTKASSDQYEYYFSGWTPSIVAVTGNKDYTAVFSSQERQYTVTLGTSTRGSWSNENSITNYYSTSVSKSISEQYGVLNVGNVSRQFTCYPPSSYTAVQYAALITFSSSSGALPSQIGTGFTVVVETEYRNKPYGVNFKFSRTTSKKGTPVYRVYIQSISGFTLPPMNHGYFYAKSDSEGYYWYVSDSVEAVCGRNNSGDYIRIYIYNNDTGSYTEVARSSLYADSSTIGTLKRYSMDESFRTY